MHLNILTRYNHYIQSGLTANKIHIYIIYTYTYISKRADKLAHYNDPHVCQDNLQVLAIQFNSIQFYLYSAITVQLSLGALQSPEPEPP